MKFAEKKLTLPEINMYDIELMLVMLGEFLFIVSPLKKRYHLVQNGRFSAKSNFKLAKFASFNLVMTI